LGLAKYILENRGLIVEVYRWVNKRFFKYWVKRAPKDKVSIVVAISTENEDHRKQLKNDFIDKLHELFSANNFKYPFSLIVWPEQRAETIVGFEEAKKYILAARAHFMIFGKARIRNIKGKSKHVLDIRALVRHVPISSDAHHAFTTEFVRVMPPRFTGFSEDDLEFYEVTADHISTAARYIIGLASMLSNDLDYAESLLESVRRDLQRGGVAKELPDLQQNLPGHLSTLYALQIRRAMWRWRKSRSLEDINLAKYYTDKWEKLDKKIYHIRIQLAIWYFVVHRDAKSALRELRECKSSEDPSWLYCRAFLLAYNNKLADAIRTYRRAFKYKVTPDFIVEIEEFIAWAIEREPNKVQLYFCLGLINHHLKGDNESALADFKKFLQETAPSQFADERILAAQYIEKLQGDDHV
jgi:tetratricopeptide (TPR) repeat protein